MTDDEISARFLATLERRWFLRPGQLASPDRSCADVRQIAVSALIECGWTMMATGALLNRDHSTISHSRDRLRSQPPARLKEASRAAWIARQRRLEPELERAKTLLQRLQRAGRDWASYDVGQVERQVLHHLPFLAWACARAYLEVDVFGVRPARSAEFLDRMRGLRAVQGVPASAACLREELRLFNDTWRLELVDRHRRLAG